MKLQSGPFVLGDQIEFPSALPEYYKDPILTKYFSPQTNF